MDEFDDFAYDWQDESFGWDDDFDWYESDDDSYDSYYFDNSDYDPYGSYDYDDYYSDGIYDEDDFESDGKSGWSSFVGGLPDTLKDFATGVAGNYAQQAIGQKYWKQRTDYEDALRAKWFDKENQYNSPAAMSSRLRAAGLNPALVLGGSSGAGAMSGSAGRRSTAAGSAPVLGAPITSPSKLAELSVMDSVANKNNAEADRAYSDVEHNSFMNRLADAQRRVQDSLIGVHNAEAAGKRINNALSKLNLDALSAVMDVTTGVDSNGNYSTTKMNVVSAKAFSEVLECSAKNVESLVKHGTIDAYFQSILDQYKIVGENLRVASANAAVAEIKQGIEEATQYAKIAEPYLSAAKEFAGIVGEVIDAVTTVKSAAAKVAALFGRTITTTEHTNSKGKVVGTDTTTTQTIK